MNSPYQPKKSAGFKIRKNKGIDVNSPLAISKETEIKRNQITINNHGQAYFEPLITRSLIDNQIEFS